MTFHRAASNCVAMLGIGGCVLRAVGSAIPVGVQTPEGGNTHKKDGRLLPNAIISQPGRLMGPLTFIAVLVYLALWNYFDRPISKRPQDSKS